MKTPKALSPIKAGDYGQADKPQPIGNKDAPKDKGKPPMTDGRKTLSLWSN